MRKALGLLASIAAVVALFPSPAQASSCQIGEPGVDDIHCVVFNEPAVRALCTTAAKLGVDCP